jgi:hypothetical protein
MSLITTLAALGQKNSIVLTLAYTPPADGVENKLAGVHASTVTVTAFIKPKENTDGEPKTLQFTGPLMEVEKELAEKLPLAVSKIVEHEDALAALDAQLAAEKEAKAKNNASKAASPGKEVKAPPGVKSRTVYPSTAKPKPEEKGKPAAKPAAKVDLSKVKAAAKGGAAAALAKVKGAAAAAPAEPAGQAMIPGTEPTPEPPAEPTAETQAEPPVDDAAAALAALAGESGELDL